MEESPFYRVRKILSDRGFIQTDKGARRIEFWASKERRQGLILNGRGKLNNARAVNANENGSTYRGIVPRVCE